MPKTGSGYQASNKVSPENVAIPIAAAEVVMKFLA
jgi:hypothetical protein